MPEAAAPVVVAHSSDLHIGARFHKHGPLASLDAVLGASADAGASVIVLAGDIFDSNRVSEDIAVEAAARIMASGREVVILPGNHDPATHDAVYRRSVLLDVPNLHVLGVTAGGAIGFPSLELEVIGAAHTAYADMPPLPAEGARTHRWRIVAAHGHWVTGDHDLHRAWLFHDHELAALDADYIALGHWDRAVQAAEAPPAYYSGSPELARTINVVTLGVSSVEVRRHPIEL